MNRIKSTNVFIVLLLFVFQNTLFSQVHKSIIKHPEWSYNLSIYEVNLRQYTEEGTFKAFEEHIPRLKELGAGILWFMPIHPIGELNRKGTLGSYYSVKDYLAVNPEHGTIEDFKSLVNKIHEAGMYVIIDWVANHTAWDNPLVTEHPEWYTKNADGNFVPPVADWADVIDLNFDNAELREYMLNALKFWVEECNIDGYRCDVAGMVPMEFWNRVREELDKIKPVFMLAEDEKPDYHEKSFDMTYSWELHHYFNEVAQEKKPASIIADYFESEKIIYPNSAFRMRFTSNHDENSWNGTEYERLGEGAETFAALSYIIPGMPLIYSGQEAAYNKRLDFFKKDVIKWEEHEIGKLYSKLNQLKEGNPCLYNGEMGGGFVNLPNSKGEDVFTFARIKGESIVIGIFNLSKDEVHFDFGGEGVEGNYKSLNNDDLEIEMNNHFKLEAWEYKILIKQ
ncbi:MAG: alpha-amylase [Ignavibacteriales bacterium]|nr:MAG: alpha-amylase [Ignavibacteriales bacterium]